VMLYEMVTGMQPYQADSTEKLERMIRSHIAPPPAPDPCPEPLRRILMKAMAPMPEVRYQSAVELAEDLEAFRKGGLVRAVTEDLEATRRTCRRDQADDDTRRSGDAPTRKSGPAPEQPASQSQTEPQKERSQLYYYARRAVAALGLVAAVYVSWVVVADYHLYGRGKEFEHDVLAEQVTDPNQIWDRWTELSKDHASSIFLRGPRNAVKAKLVAAADHVIGTYRNNDAQPVYENDWDRARTMLLHALSADPDDQVRGKLRLCEGHLARINGASHRSLAELNDAVEKFTEAGRLMQGSPDPPLGLARVYVQGLRDIDKASQAFQQAVKNGYQLGKREKFQMAEAYLDRADRLWWDSRNVRGLPQEKDQIQRAADDYKRALDLYQEVTPYANASSRIVRVQADLDSVNIRLQQIDSGLDQLAVAGRNQKSVGNAIVGLIDALRGRAAQRKGSGPGGPIH